MVIAFIDFNWYTIDFTVLFNYKDAIFMVKLYDKVMLFLIYLIKGSVICIMYLTVHVWLPDLYFWIVHVWKILNLLFIWILKLKYTKSNMCYYFLRSIILFYQKFMLVFSLTKIFHTFVCPYYAVSHVCFFFT